MARLVQEVRSGRSAVLVLRGDPGIGKSALLEHLAGTAMGSRILRVTGVESQMELAFAGLRQLCEPLMDELARLPAPQADALRSAFGLRPGSAPDRFMIGLAALTLLSEGARDKPLLCLVDDAQWLDRATAQTLTFVARRLAAESVALVLAARTGEDEQTWAGFPQQTIGRLLDPEAEALLDSAVPGPLDNRVLRRILAEAHGNPLALLELPRWFTSTELTFGPRPDGVRTLTDTMEEGIRRQLELLPERSRSLLLTAAAEPLGDVGLLWRAAERGGIGVDAAPPAEMAGLIELRDTVLFRHPLVRSVVYRTATLQQRRAVHHALAEATDPEVDADRRAWHRAHAAVGPDEDVAAELEHSAQRALAHGGLAAAAAFLDRAAALTPDTSERARRRLDAVQTMLHAGTFDAAVNLLAATERDQLSDLQRARVDILRAQLGFASQRGNEALPLLLAAARRLEPLDVELALDSYVDALAAALFAGRLTTGPGCVDVGHAARSVPIQVHPRRGDVLLQAVAVRYADGYPAAAPLFRQAVDAFDTDQLTLEEGVRFLWLAAVVATELLDERAWDRLTTRHLNIVRSAGALSALPLALNTRVFVDLFAGDLASAAALVEEINAANDAAETTLVPYGAIALAAFRGHAARATPLIADAITDVTTRGEGIGVALAYWARALLCNGLGRYGAALEAGREGAAFRHDLGIANWTLVELIEAAARAGEPHTAADAFEVLSENTRASGTNWALGVAARSGALLSDGVRAEELYREALDRLGRTGQRFEMGRARLLYGEWLLSAGRLADAREMLRAAHEELAAMRVDAFAQRARRALVAAGEAVKPRSSSTVHQLTPQELHIARLAVEGRTNPEIGAELFISPRTVEWHMGKMFAKLGIKARGDLGGALLVEQV